MKATLRFPLFSWFLLCQLACGTPVSQMATSWPEADKLFLRDRHWVGGDGAYSINLGGGRILWLFGDSWIDKDGEGKRKGATLVSNSLAIQEGADPSRASIRFYWGDKGSRPESFFPGNGNVRYWPGHGLLLGDKLLLFLMEVHHVEGGLGFEVRGWSAVLVSNPGDEPCKWDVRWLDCPESGRGIVVGSGAVLVSGGFVHSFSGQEPGPKHDVFLVRWPLGDIGAGKLEGLQWWCGKVQGWVLGTRGEVAAKPVFGKGQTEFTVHFDPVQSCFVQTQTEGFGKAVVVQRFAQELTGPWSGKVKVFDPPENRFGRIMVYQGKAHPHLRGTGLVLTYCTNSFEFADHFKEPWLYFPRFVKVVGGSE
jgi:hypothetical protein